MEGQNVFENSLKELTRIQKESTTGSVNIDFDKLDSVSAGVLKDVIHKAVTARKNEVTNVVTRATY